MVGIPAVGFLNGKVQLFQGLVGAYFDLAPYPSCSGQRYMQGVGLYPGLHLRCTHFRLRCFLRASFWRFRFALRVSCRRRSVSRFSFHCGSGVD
jgi:hypothetical protein